MQQPQFKKVNIPFQCSYTWPDGQVAEGDEFETWDGVIDRICERGPYTEFHISGRSGLTLIVGPYTNGYILAIPTYSVVLDLSFPQDLFYNKEKATRCEHGNIIDQVTAVYAFKALADAGLYEVSPDHEVPVDESGEYFVFDSGKEVS
ncbi:hypothetical protein JJB07_14600 [Tumebacillus sp. ITR2]|uniref:Uncharacterized protein n=1 Tax=Tumebacillus amylolyticus TaxID=2801339 RepID=A0ABS1JE56_9BACL|nr:hypothetical protein [Tumebacillus amylolyticus]MBL0387868.1 hypothetical protein [Tumebacillus amylolyticus]